MKTGLVLEGGATRGLFTCGVLDTFMGAGITFDGIIGVSAGAAFGCNYKSHQPARALRYNLRYAKDPRYAGLLSLIATGDIYGGKFCYETLPAKLDIMDIETYRKDPSDFYVVMTDVYTGAPVYRKVNEINKEGLLAIRASASMPLVSKPVEVDGGLYLDGGLSDSIPLQAMQEMGYEKCVVILTRPRGYEKQPQKGMKAISAALKKYPAVARDIKDRPAKYNAELAYIKAQEETGNVLVIAPEEELEISRPEHNRERIRNVYNIGRNTGRGRVEQVKAFLR